MEWKERYLVFPHPSEVLDARGGVVNLAAGGRLLRAVSLRGSRIPLLSACGILLVQSE